MIHDFFEMQSFKIPWFSKKKKKQLGEIKVIEQLIKAGADIHVLDGKLKTFFEIYDIKLI